MRVEPVLEVEKDTLVALNVAPLKANAPDLGTRILLLREGRIVELSSFREVVVYEDENVSFKLCFYDPAAIPADAVIAYFSHAYGFIELHIPERWDAREVEEQWKMWADYFGFDIEPMLDVLHRKFLWPLDTPVTVVLKAGERYVAAPVLVDETREDAPAVLVEVFDENYNLLSPVFALNPPIHRSVTIKLSFYKADSVAYYTIAL